jgi:hypothetical protein
MKLGEALMITAAVESCQWDRKWHLHPSIMGESARLLAHFYPMPANVFRLVGAKTPDPSQPSAEIHRQIKQLEKIASFCDLVKKKYRMPGI